MPPAEEGATEWPTAWVCGWKKEEMQFQFFLKIKIKIKIEEGYLNNGFNFQHRPKVDFFLGSKQRVKVCSDPTQNSGCVGPKRKHSGHGCCCMTLMQFSFSKIYYFLKNSFHCHKLYIHIYI